MQDLSAYLLVCCRLLIISVKLYSSRNWVTFFIQPWRIQWESKMHNRELFDFCSYRDDDRFYIWEFLLQTIFQPRLLLQCHYVKIIWWNAWWVSKSSRLSILVFYALPRCCRDWSCYYVHFDSGRVSILWKFFDDFRAVLPNLCAAAQKCAARAVDVCCGRMSEINSFQWEVSMTFTNLIEKRLIS